MLIKNNLAEAKTKYYLALVANILISVHLIVVMSGFFIEHIPTYTNKAKLTEVLSFMPAIQSDLMAKYSSSGHWPQEKVIRDNSDMDYSIIDNIRFDGAGTINVYFKDRYEGFSNKILSFVANVHSLNKINTITWTCGYALPLDGFIPMSKNNTTIAPLLLPGVCKQINYGELLMSPFKQDQEN